ncbi:cache domain-containing protein [Anaeromyxobacter sp. Fw109-5]|uniref:cache domain-containing protein n=1 Tax=Anaeromyxobacter sp. (strain Fw109-5) TaxID=404589 RepID=UPI000158A856|nr:cache domain-containing protein [Anaeromyxobacter sp. Fw109-5]ABS28209.1 putative PAS/PAC sensor protein [Anaeromyxobacter sp. Fw109-5]
MTLKLKLQLAISVAVLVTAVVVAGYAVGSLRSQAAADVARIRAEKTAQVKQDLADKVNTVYALIDAQYREAADERYLEQKYGQRLEAILDVAGATLREHLERARRGEVPVARAQAEALATLRAMRFDGGKGYLWINTVGRPYPTMLMHPLVPRLEGTVLDAPEFDCAGDANRNLFQLAVELTAARGEGFIRYSWPEPDGNALLPQMPKFSYVRLFKEWGWVVGTGIYVDEAVREKLAEITSGIRKIRYGSEYFWISTAESPVPRMVMHPIRPELDGQRMDAKEFELVVNGRAQNLFSAFRDLSSKDGEGFVEYTWPKPTAAGAPGPAAPKVSFVKRYRPLDWIIGTGRYVDDIEVAIAEKTAAAEEQVGALVRRIMLASLVVVVLAVAGVSFLAATLTKPLAKLVGLSRDIAEDEKHLSRRIGLRSRDEIGQLATEFDHMAERVEASFRNVREQRELLLSVLSNVPHSIYWKDRRSVYLGCNDRFAQRFGLPSTEAIVGKTDAQLGWSDEQRARLAAGDRRVMDEGAPLLDEREHLRDASGRDIDCLASRVPLRDQAGNLIGMLGVFVAIPPDDRALSA